MPNLHESASVDSEGRIHITVANTSLSGGEPLAVHVPGREGAKASARTLAGVMDAHNTFEQPDAVKPVPLDVQWKDGSLCLTLPACSVTAITIE